MNAFQMEGMFAFQSYLFIWLLLRQLIKANNAVICFFFFFREVKFIFFIRIRFFVFLLFLSFWFWSEFFVQRLWFYLSSSCLLFLLSFRLVLDFFSLQSSLLLYSLSNRIFLIYIFIFFLVRFSLFHSLGDSCVIFFTLIGVHLCVSPLRSGSSCSSGLAILRIFRVFHYILNLNFYNYWLS